ncbi:MAG: hypothetical protein IPO67_00130 [Deltaproteobacteria bacterium]|nr:hypothetical protein [Deltaproteobacteria bacterium]
MFTLLLTLAACATTPQPPEPTAPAEPATPSAQAPTQLQTLTLEPRLMTWDDAAGTVIYSPGSDRMTSEYTHFVLSAASVEAVLGGRPTEPVTVEVEVAGPTLTTQSPEDPNLPQPQDGYQITTWTGRAVRKVE